jgi:hypothetical protein
MGGVRYGRCEVFKDTPHTQGPDSKSRRAEELKRWQRWREVERGGERREE